MNRFLSAAVAVCFVAAPAYLSAQQPSLPGLSVPVNLRVGAAKSSGSAAKQAVAGVFTVKKFVVEGTGEQSRLMAVGVLQFAHGGKNNVASVALPVSKASTTLSTATTVGGVTKMADIQSAQALAECPILNLTIGPIFLDLLGLVVETNEIQLDITAVSGPGNLLGNLLCAIAGLLDPNGGLLTGLLQAIANLLNEILGAIGG